MDSHPPASCISPRDGEDNADKYIYFPQELVGVKESLRSWWGVDMWMIGKRTAGKDTRCLEGGWEKEVRKSSTVERGLRQLGETQRKVKEEGRGHD